MLYTGARHGTHPPSRVPALAACAALDAEPPPARVDWFEACPADGDALNNNRIGCCVPAADYRWIEATLANVGSPGWRPTGDQVLARYIALTGYDPVTGIGDVGTPVVMDIADLTTRGIRLPELQRQFVPWATTIDPKNDVHLAAGVGRIGAALCTFVLPRNWLAIESDPNAWNVAPGQGSDWDPVEAHRVLFGKFDGLLRWARSWGLDLPIHPEWWRRYCVGVDLLVDRNGLDASGRSATGLDLSGLLRVMGAVA